MRFGVGGGGRAVRGGVSVGRGGARGGVGVGPFSVSGGFGGRGESTGLGELLITLFWYVFIAGICLLLAISAVGVVIIAAITGATSHLFWLIVQKTCESLLKLKNASAALFLGASAGCAITLIPVTGAIFSPLASPEFWDSRFTPREPGNQWLSVVFASAVHVICWGTALTCLTVVITVLFRQQRIANGYPSGLEMRSVRGIASSNRLQQTTQISIDGVDARVPSSSLDRMRFQAASGDQVDLLLERFKPYIWFAIENAFPAIMIVRTNWSKEKSMAPVRNVELPEVLASARAAKSAGWYADPSGVCELRYWDGEKWTKQVEKWGQKKTDVIGLKRITHAEHEERRRRNLEKKHG